MTERDKLLIEKAKRTRWEDIDEDAAETPEARALLRQIVRSKYHREND